MGQEKQANMPFMRRLLRDKTANTLAISAAALVPLMAMVGGGVDASRYYMAAARMQSACDAGALATRQAMTTTTMSTAQRQIGLNFFDQNFNDGLFGVTGRTRNYTANSSGVVTGTASGVLPATIMGAFGYTQFNISVSCSAEVNISNTDIMFVLDVTGSMAQCPNGSNCGGGAGSKIVALRQAVMSFYETVQSATSTGAQVRYGMVPYSSQVNVGYSLPRVHLINRHSYQSRVARFREETTTIPGNGVRPGDTIVISDQLEWLPRDTANFGVTGTDVLRFRNSNRSAREAAEEFCFEDLPGTYTVNNETWRVYDDTEFVNPQWETGATNNRAACRGRVRKTRVATQADVVPDRTETNIVFQDYLYCRVEIGNATPCGVTNPAGSPQGWETIANLSAFYVGNRRVNLPTGVNGAMESHTWAGCIEEPDTVLADNYNPIPAGAHDLNINLVPANDSQRWRPALLSAVYDRGGPNNVASNNWVTGYSTCPVPARTLAPITQAELQTYVDSLTTAGNTYHDIGMVWGARFISPRGIFAANNTSAPNGDPISRHIVFMTDGAQQNWNTDYATHGVERMDRRITGNGDEDLLEARRASRLQAICRAAKQEGITVWVVAFGTALTTELENCASPGRAFPASDNATLTARFREIAQKIAALRLTS